MLQKQEAEHLLEHRRGSAAPGFQLIPHQRQVSGGVMSHEPVLDRIRQELNQYAGRDASDSFLFLVTSAARKTLLVCKRHRKQPDEVVWETGSERGGKRAILIALNRK